jgi:hypothetical protein
MIRLSVYCLWSMILLTIYKYTGFLRARSHDSLFLPDRLFSRLGVFRLMFRRYGNSTVHRTQLYTVLEFQLHLYRIRIKTREYGLEYIYINILVSQVSSIATDFKSTILGTSYCETKE